MDNSFNNILLAIVFDPKEKKILIGKEKKDSAISWCFPEGKPDYSKDIDNCLKKEIKTKTGYEIENLGAVFANTYSKEKKLFAIYYLCEVVGGKEIPGNGLIELKWVSPDELEKHLTISFHPNLKEYIMNLR